MDGLLARGDFSYVSGETAARELLSSLERPTAIIASNDQMALACLDVANEMGIEVPADLSLISFDNTPIVRFTTPKLTAIDQPIAETASVAVDLIIEAKKGEEPPKDTVVVAASLVHRGSVAPLRD